MNNTGTLRPKVALVSVGLGRVQRGFERYFRDLFGILRDEMDITLYKSAGPRNSREDVPPFLKSATAIARALPLGRFAGSAEYHRDCIAFGLCLLPRLLQKRFDVVHCIDPPLAVVLGQLRRTFRFNSRLLFTEGCVMPPEHYPRVDHIHHVAQMSYQHALESGVSPDRMTLVPCGLHTGRFAVPLDRQESRRKHRISDSTFVILMISAIKRHHKRVDHVIEEVSRVRGDVMLWIDGNLEDPAVVELARRKLGARCRITHVSSAEVAELYRSADVLVHASLSESFGLAIVEALSCGAMVLAHDSPHFEWLIQDRACLLDMRLTGELAGRLQALAGRKKHEVLERTAERAARVRQRFDWRVLKRAYLRMYSTVATCLA